MFFLVVFQQATPICRASLDQTMRNLLCLLLVLPVTFSLRFCTSDEDCFGSYCVTGPGKKAPFTCHKDNIPSKQIGIDIHSKAVFLPMQGLGTWQYNDTVAGAAVESALKMGYGEIAY